MRFTDLPQYYRVVMSFRLQGLIAACGVASLLVGNALYRPKPFSDSRLSVAMPLPAQIVLAGGDRYLAANFGVLRAIMVGVDRLPAETIRALALIQTDASVLNPAHEDNYYTAAAILPWEGQVASAQAILKRAIDARPHDIYPPFYYGFNQIHFLGDARGASDVARAAGQRMVDPAMTQMFTVLAVKWLQQDDDLQYSIDSISAMASQTRDKALRQYLADRAKRIEGLVILRQAAKRFFTKYGQPPSRLDDLVSSGELAAIPADPLQAGYSISNGEVVFAMPRRQ